MPNPPAEEGLPATLFSTPRRSARSDTSRAPFPSRSNAWDIEHGMGKSDPEEVDALIVPGGNWWKCSMFLIRFGVVCL